MSHGRQESGTTDIAIDEELENRRWAQYIRGRCGQANDRTPSQTVSRFYYHWYAAVRIHLDIIAYKIQDWVQDAALERHRRLRNASLLQRASRGATDKSLSARLWLQVQKAAIAGQSWFVVSLAGEHVATRREQQIPFHEFRCLYRSQRCFDINSNRVALRPQEWVLHRQLVAQPGFLLLGDRGRRGRSM